MFTGVNLRHGACDCGPCRSLDVYGKQESVSLGGQVSTMICSSFSHAVFSSHSQDRDDIKMNHFDRREFLRHGSLGFGAIGFGALVLPSQALPTEPSGDRDEANLLAAAAGAIPQPIAIEPPRLPDKFAPTEDNILGPFFRQGAPYRAKITPPMEPGQLLVVRGRVWGFDSKKPLAGTVLDIWQANAQGRYDNDNPKNTPKKGVFHNRARLITDETGYYEFETIKPGRYKIGPKTWRPSHVHYLIRKPGYKSLVTQLYFKGDPYNRSDRFIKRSLIIDPETVKSERGSYLLGTFDIVLGKGG